MTTPNETAERDVTYGNLISPKLPGLGSLGFGSTMFAVFSAIVLIVLVAVLQLLTVAVVWLAISAAVLAPATFPTKDGYGRYQMMWRRRMHARAEKAGRTALRQGLTGHVPDGECRLPGLAAPTRLRTYRDVHSREFGLIVWPEQDLYTVVIEAFPTGFEGLDKSTIDSCLAHWAAWLGRLNTVEEIAGAAVVVETVPDSGRRLLRAVRRGRVNGAPQLSRGVTDQILNSYHVGTPATTVRLTVTLSAIAPGSTDEPARTEQEMADLIGDLLPTWTGSLDMTGAGTGARPCTAQEITDYVRVAFDPSVAELVEEAQLRSGEDGGGTGIEWAQAGPISAWNHWEYYEHETAVSRTWQMKEPPRGVFFAQTLHHMLAPHKDIARKRVALLYRPESPEISATASERDVKNARLKATQGRYAKAAAAGELEAAQRTTKQVAMGSPLIRVGLLVTVTVRDTAELARASRAVKTGLAGQARIALRLPKGAQDVSFLSSLPLGLVPQSALRAPGKHQEGAA
ncbi:hypothetical protein CU254_42320 (plasmid) [Amycolatopsis sp. AA4]|uniref:SCO6880 family protein n=1 Tax=Actinomycetes TaxID=1760 RepID=UPI0001B5768F|nr:MULTISPECIES: SCO6880 family protein [Actinomycetes]ATY17225.1 hypothetical protein CU254_42320 [Amycolatopsis sp. AA4]EFL12716.1 predicted protein [Streptomyces sp. AA4]